MRSIHFSYLTNMILEKKFLCKILSPEEKPYFWALLMSLLSQVDVGLFFGDNSFWGGKGKPVQPGQ